jgi:hypothetical protein
MTRRLAFLAIALAVLPAAAKSSEERWIASSKTAMSITGDIRLSPTRLRMAAVVFPLKVAADLPRFDGDNGPVAARVLKVTRPADPKLLNGNRLGCNLPIRWIVVWRFDGGSQLGMDTFTGTAMPTSVNDKGFCGSYFYVRPSR